MIISKQDVEAWCRVNNTKLVLADDLRITCDEDGNSHNGLAYCPDVWIKPFNQYSEEYILEHEDEELPPIGECTVHKKCRKCGGCVTSKSSTRCEKCRGRSKTKKNVNPLFEDLERLELEQLRRIAAENDIETSSRGGRLVVMKDLKEYLDLHGRFKRDLPKPKYR